MNGEQIRAILWSALARIGNKESRRELLSGGTAHQCSLRVAGTVDGLVWRGENIAGLLSIGVDGVQSASTAAATAEIVAYLLAMLPKTKRDKLLAELPAAFLAAGKLPDVDADRLAEAERLLSRLRARKEQPVAGAVTWTYASPPPKPAAKLAA